MFRSESGTEVSICSWFDDKIVAEMRNPDSLVNDNEGLFTPDEIEQLGKLLISASKQFRKTKNAK